MRTPHQEAVKVSLIGGVGGGVKDHRDMFRRFLLLRLGICAQGKEYLPEFRIACGVHNVATSVEPPGDTGNQRWGSFAKGTTVGDNHVKIFKLTNGPLCFLDACCHPNDGRAVDAEDEIVVVEDCLLILNKKNRERSRNSPSLYMGSLYIRTTSVF